MFPCSAILCRLRPRAKTATTSGYPARVHPYFVPIDLSTGTIGNQIKLPYSPNSMVLDPTGTTLYFGSYKELMTYTATTNSLASEVANVPGVVLAVSPTNSAVVINDQLRGVIYLYTPSSGAYTSFAGIGQKAAFTPDGQTVYIVGNGVLYIHNNFTGWSVETLPATRRRPQPASARRPTPPAPFPRIRRATRPIPRRTPTTPTTCSALRILAVTIPAAAVFLSGATTVGYGQCPEPRLSRW